MAREYDIAKASGRCGACERELAAGEEYVAALFDQAGEFSRDDFCVACWDGRDDAAEKAYSVWRARVPRPEEPAKPFVDDEVLINFFERLADDDEPGKVGFRFVLALMLMRKKILVYEGTESQPDGTEVWRMRFRRSDEPVEVVHPAMDAAKITEVTAHLGAIFRGPT